MLELISSLFFGFLGLLVNALGFLFSWLPDDPFADAVSSFTSSVQTGGFVGDAFTNGLALLNWLVDIPMLISVFGAFVGCVVVWLCAKLVMLGFSLVRDAVNLVPVVE